MGELVGDSEARSGRRQVASNNDAPLPFDARERCASDYKARHAPNRTRAEQPASE